jgi:hypothetical protein
VTITRDGFTGVVDNAFASHGFPAEASKVVFPSALFLPGSDISPISERFDEIVAGLTTWSPERTETGVFSPPMVTVQAASRAEAADAVNARFLQEMWSDGLRLAPPTERRVDWVLTGTDRDEDEVIGHIQPRRGVATVESLAICLAMAGGRPEYLPVLIAAVEAMVEEPFEHQRMNTTTCSVYPAVVVNGPVADDIRLSSGYGCMGPDPTHPAGASLGRALRFVLMDIGGAVPGNTTMAIFGGPGRFTGTVFAEDEAGLPAEGWVPFGVDQGHAAGANVVTAYPVSSTTNCPGGETGTADAVTATLNRAAGCIGIPNGNYWVTPYNSAGSAGILVIGRGTARGLAETGWSKQDVREYLWEHSKVPAAELQPRIETWWVPSEEIMEDPMPVSPSSEGIEIVVAGGDQSGHMMWLQVGCCPESMTSAEVALPGNWDALLEQAEQDLGPPAGR